MKVVHQISELRQYLAELKRQVEQKKQGSSRLRRSCADDGLFARRAHQPRPRGERQTDIVVLSIFVYRLQFGPNEDYDRYPRDKERDLRIAQENGVDVVFMPEVQEMYPHQPPDFRVTVSENLAGKLCGKSRPGHFDGVATVVLKLFQIVQPDKAFFGLKDAQQVAVICRMTEDLNVPVEIVACPTVRESDGLPKFTQRIFVR